MMPNLQDKIALAFAKKTPSGAIEKLIQESKSALEEASNRAEAAKERALDPSLSSKETENARREMENAAFGRDRFQVAISKLDELLKEALRREEDERRWRAYNAAREERDALAKEVERVYPNLARRLAELASRLAKNDKTLDHINKFKLPSGAASLRSAEYLARKFAGTRVPSEIPTISKSMKLPAYHFEPRNPYEWPPQSDSIFG